MPSLHQSTPLHLLFIAGTGGTITFQLKAPGQRLAVTTSDRPYDSLALLTTALVAFHQTGVADPVRWATRRGEYDFLLTTQGDTGQCMVLAYPDRGRSMGSARSVFAVTGDRAALILPFWRALRMLETHNIRRYPDLVAFPQHDYDRLTALIRP